MGQSCKRVRFAGLVPRCVENPEIYKSWVEAREVNGIFTNKNTDFCEDCTPDYQKSMVKKSLCENPHVEFRRDDEGNWEGFVPPLTKYERCLRRRKPIKINVKVIN